LAMWAGWNAAKAKLGTSKGLQGKARQTKGNFGVKSSRGHAWGGHRTWIAKKSKKEQHPGTQGDGESKRLKSTTPENPGKTERSRGGWERSPGGKPDGQGVEKEPKTRMQDATQGVNRKRRYHRASEKVAVKTKDQKTVGKLCAANTRVAQS